MISIGLGALYVEAHLAGLLDVELALGPPAVGADLHEIPDHGLHARQVSADLVEQRALLGVEGGGLLARCAGAAESEPLPNGKVNGKKLGGFCWVSAAAGVVPVAAGVEPLAAPPAAPVLGCGAGVGSGTFSAKAGAIAGTPQSVAMRTKAAQIFAAPAAAISISR